MHWTKISTLGMLFYSALLNIRFLAGGAVVLKREPDPELIPKSERKRPYHSPAGGPLAKCSHYIVYHEGSATDPAIKYNMEHIRSLPAAWLFECIHNFKLVDPFC